ncbi:hypothetical protein ECMP0215613_3710 [Escherichia coli MP021561.3]|nr:hypothetical protein ECMP0215613_3710 [Escherichia coli MP021561.3]
MCDRCFFFRQFQPRSRMKAAISGLTSFSSIHGSCLNR